MDIQVLEKLMFGTVCGRLTWHPYGSPLSKHHPVQHKDRTLTKPYVECVGMEPTKDGEYERLLNNNRIGSSDSERLFTLVDTVSMTVTEFRVRQAPDRGDLMCGREGGIEESCPVLFTTGRTRRSPAKPLSRMENIHHRQNVPH